MNKIKVITILLIGSLFISACSKDYLATSPTDSKQTPSIFETTKGAALAINGINKLMTTQLLSTQGFNGEGTIKMFYGNYPGNHFFTNMPGWDLVINGQLRENISSIYLYYPWYYYYMLIGNANAIIVNIDNATGPEADRQFIKAQALTFRAYSYFMLSQIYCNRWSDSSNGATDGLVLRTDLSTGDLPLSSLSEVYQRVYDDLNEAIELYKTSGKVRVANYDPDVNVAYAIYARAALTRQDYNKAHKMAISARTGYPLMSNNEYRAGFFTPNKEWIWSSYGASDESLFYFSYFAYIAYNSNASAVRNYPKCISKELYNKIPVEDVRKTMFLDPTGYLYDTSTGQTSSSSALAAKARQMFPALYPTASIYAYMQFKIGAADLPGVGNLNHFRSSEMYLIEAEAKYFSGDEQGAINALEFLNRQSGRNPSYVCTKTGSELLEEIKLYRAIELWGEGFDWFDLKRWGDGINRKSVEAGGNFIPVLAITASPQDGNEWTWKIPQKETDYNGGIN